MTMIQPQREHLPLVRPSLTQRAEMVDAHGGVLEVYLTISFYPDGRPGEMFITAAKVGSVLRGLFDAMATMASYALQYGVPATAVAEALISFEFEPRGATGDPEHPQAKSIVDWIGKRLLAAS